MPFGVFHYSIDKRANCKIMFCCARLQQAEVFMKALIISDVHGNIEALRAVEKAAGDVDIVLFLGDVLDYGPQPKECIEWLRARSWKCLRGNHDNAVITRVDCQCGQSFHDLSVATRELMWKLLDDGDYDYLRPFKPEETIDLGGQAVYAAHAAPSDPMFKYLRPSTPDSELAAEAGKAGAGIALLGHTHLQMDRTAGGVRFVNPGSVGQPRDGDPRTAFALWRDGDISFHRIDYDVDATVRALEKCDLAPHVIERLARVLKTGS